MPILLSDAIRRTRARVDESSTRFWTDTELTDWINDACRDIARRSEDLQSFTQQIPVLPNIPQYLAPVDLIRVHRLEFVPLGSTTFVYPLRAATYAELDQMWGTRQNIPATYPSFYALWGTPGGLGNNALQIRIYPAPSQPGNLNLFYYRLPYRFLDPIANTGELVKNVEVPEGWDDLVVEYAAGQAFMKEQNAAWKDVMGQYEKKMGELIDVSRQWHDQQRMIMTASGLGQPAWLTGFGD